MSVHADSVDLYYWPAIPGRGEYVRLVLEAAGVPYRDVARLPEEKGGGVHAMLAFLQSSERHPAPFAPPVLVESDGTLLWQSALITAHLGEKHGLAPADAPSRLAARAIAMTIADFVDEVHDTHHPLGVSRYYEEQTEAAQERALAFRDERMPKYLGFLERCVTDNPTLSGYLVGDSLTYADLALFQTLEGLAYAFPRRLATLRPDVPAIFALHHRVADDPRLADYLASDRRLPFNEDGLFRAYPELDGD
ncbi:glutathione S-transferase [Aurantimonas sp. Leaf443]|uniref:glutathione S-transferase n=1 Tax=Aurantimonas sp. Leaf443 TaxID=1736378 RepID=UPI0006F72240|nr:glutathione S-transferase [Aurantimonas sp. Leaf443]KQT84019.1 glutathione S-transferase [Aurantimonas sp. Leaf443]